MIEAAGGVVWHQPDEGALQVLVIHRPRYDDWSLPKGKLDAGEPAPDAAVREVEEETGLRCRLGDELPEVRYEDGRDRPKRVRYWSMEVIDGAFEPNREVDEVRWVPSDQVASVLSYPHDVDVVRAFVRMRSAAA
jgi:8-oxo-dGTP pyrophosphatase MutT (NUDIX family)